MYIKLLAFLIVVYILGCLLSQVTREWYKTECKSTNQYKGLTKTPEGQVDCCQKNMLSSKTFQTWKCEQIEKHSDVKWNFGKITEQERPHIT